MRGYPETFHISPKGAFHTSGADDGKPCVRAAPQNAGENPQEPKRIFLRFESSKIDGIENRSAGVVKRLLVKEGQTVAADAVLVEIDTDAPAARPESAADAPVTGKIVDTPMPGSVFKVLVKPGDTVAKGQTVIVLEAMKMENNIAATHDDTVKRVFVTEGQTVPGGARLVEIEI